MPDILPPMPWMISGSSTTAVPEPSHTHTEQSSMPLVTHMLISSDIPKLRKSFMRISRRSVNMPKSRMRNSTFSRMLSLVSFSMPLCL